MMPFSVTAISTYTIGYIAVQHFRTTIKKTLYLQFGSYKVSQARLKGTQILRAIARCHVV